MLVDGINLIEGSDINNMVVDSGASFPSSPNAGELFYKTSVTAGLYVYDGSNWNQAGAGGGGVPGGVTGQVQFNSSLTFAGSPKFTWSDSTVVLSIGEDASNSNATLQSTSVSSGTGTNLIISGGRGASLNGGGSLSLRAGRSADVLTNTSGNTGPVLSLYGGGGGGLIGVGGSIQFFTAPTADGFMERLRITKDGALGLAGPNYGTAGQVLTSNGSTSAPSWGGIGAATYGLTIPLTAIVAGAQTLARSDIGEVVAASGTITVPASVFLAGDVIAVYNDTAVNVSIVQGASLTLRLVGTATTGNRTLAQRGWATIWFRSATEAVISGGGLT